MYRRLLLVTTKVFTMSTSNESTEGQTGESHHEEPGAIPRKPEDIECQNREEKIADLLANGTNVYLSGGGGTGKSYCLKNVYLRLMERGLTVYKAGSTGVAAESIGGMTLHSWAGVQLGDKDAETYYITIQGRNRKAWLRWKQTSVLIIDEISMTGGKFFQMLSDLGKRIRGCKLPFGGITLLICGDVCQLPPVKDSYFFQTDVYHDFNFSVIRLTHPWRFQKDIDFFYILSRVRVGEQTPGDIQKLEERKVAYYKDIYNKKYKPGEIRPTRMFSK
jgi:ATP-dependent DNA helicase PIF1